jgi:hypothetical protein
VLKEYELTSDLTAVDEVNADTEKPTGQPPTTLPKGTTFYLLLQRHRSEQFPGNEYCLILSKGKAYLPLADQLEGKYILLGPPSPRE